MASTSRVKSWVSGDTLTAADLNAEFNNLLTGGINNIENANIASGAAISTSKIAGTAVTLAGVETLTNKDLTSATNTLPSSTVTLTGTQTLTNKRITKRVGTTADSSAPTPDADSHDVYTVTALAQAATFGAPSGTPTNGQTLVIRVKDNGTARALSFNAIYRFPTDLPAPTTTTVNKTLYLGFIYNSTDTKWDCVANIDNL